MKRHFRIISIFSALIYCGCTALTEPEKPSLTEIGHTADEEPFRITIGLAGDGADTRLSYSEVDFESRRAIRTCWSEGDIIVANASPGNTNYVYSFNLVEGQGTSTGTFECNGSPQNMSSNAWTIYFPGSKIKGEADYLTHSYLGQVQTGNGNMDHLGEYHTLRLICTDGSTYITFDDSYIDLSGEDLDESSCLKFNLSNLPEMVPTEVALSYSAPSGYESSCFSTHNRLTTWWTGSVSPDNTTTSSIVLGLEDFQSCSSIAAYIMMSNYPVHLHNGGTLRVTVTDNSGKKYYCDKPLTKDVTLDGGLFHSITCTSWKETSAHDGFAYPDTGVIVLQEATVGNGTDIIIMGDGFAEDQFGDNGSYEEIMDKAYDDFFSVEPYATLKDYFNVYYIKAVSENNHDAEPYYDTYNNQNGATNGSASTVFKTQFTPGATTISGDNAMALEYARQAIRAKGGSGGKACTDEDEVVLRVNKSLIMVMVNVNCHAGTCSTVWTTGCDYGNGYSVAYTALGNSEEQRRWTTIHEAGGHGFGKLADEYGGSTITSFSTGNWDMLTTHHNTGIYRNVNEYWSQVEREAGWSFSWTDTDKTNVYWSDLFSDSYGYTTSEGLDIYRGGYTYSNLFCRPTENSVMRNQFGDNGKFFNAISRWAIWYRLMRLTGQTTATDFKASLSEFIKFDNELKIEIGTAATKSAAYDDGSLPLAPPVLQKAEWVEGGPHLRIL